MSLPNLSRCHTFEPRPTTTLSRSYRCRRCRSRKTFLSCAAERVNCWRNNFRQHFRQPLVSTIKTRKSTKIKAEGRFNGPFFPLNSFLYCALRVYRVYTYFTETFTSVGWHVLCWHQLDRKGREKAFSRKLSSTPTIGKRIVNSAFI